MGGAEPPGHEGAVRASPVRRREESVVLTPVGRDRFRRSRLALARMARGGTQISDANTRLVCATPSTGGRCFSTRSDWWTSRARTAVSQRTARCSIDLKRSNPTIGAVVYNAEKCLRRRCRSNLLACRSRMQQEQRHGTEWQSRAFTYEVVGLFLCFALVAIQATGPTRGMNKTSRSQITSSRLVRNLALRANSTSAQTNTAVAAKARTVAMPSYPVGASTSLPVERKSMVSPSRFKC